MEEEDPIKVGAVAYEYYRPQLLGVVEEVELREDGPREGTVQYARVRWLNGPAPTESANAPPGQNWCIDTFLRIADPIDALAALGGVHRKPEG